MKKYCGFPRAHLGFSHYKPLTLDIFLEFVIVKVHSLVSGNVQEQYNDPQNLNQLLTHWFERPPKEFNLFADTRGQEELTWEQFVSNHESLEKKIIYILELAPPTSQEDLLKKFPPLLEIRELTTGAVISRYDSKNPKNMRQLLIGEDQPPTVEAIEASLKDYGPRLDIWPTWNPYSIFADPQGFLLLTWEELLLSWGAEKIKTVYILYHETPENPLRWDDLTDDQIPSYARRVRWDYTAYFAARGYVLMDENPGMYVRTF